MAADIRHKWFETLLSELYRQRPRRAWYAQLLLLVYSGFNRAHLDTVLFQMNRLINFSTSTSWACSSPGGVVTGKSGTTYLLHVPFSLQQWFSRPHPNGAVHYGFRVCATLVLTQYSFVLDKFQMSFTSPASITVILLEIFLLSIL